MNRRAAGLNVLLRSVTMPTEFDLVAILIGSFTTAFRCGANLSNDSGIAAINRPVASSPQYISIELQMTGAVGRPPRDPKISSTREPTCVPG